MGALATSASAFAVVEVTWDLALAFSASAVAEVTVEATGDCALRSSGIHNTEDTLVVGLSNSLVTIDLVRLNSGAGLLGVLTEILGIPGGVTTGSTAR